MSSARTVVTGGTKLPLAGTAVVRAKIGDCVGGLGGRRVMFSTGKGVVGVRGSLVVNMGNSGRAEGKGVALVGGCGMGQGIVSGGA